MGVDLVADLAREECEKGAGAGSVLCLHCGDGRDVGVSA